MSKSPIERAIEVAGSESKLGALAGYSQVAINKAKRRGYVTAAMAVAIERATGVARNELCPEIFDVPVATPQPEEAA